MDERKLKNSNFISLVIDGWKNVKRLPVVNVIVLLPEPMFYKTIECNGDKQDGKFYEKLLDDTIKEIGKNKIVAVISDNATELEMAKRIINVNYPNILPIKCAAHWLNLLVKDLSKLPSFHKIISDVSHFVSIFIHSKIKMATLEDEWKYYIEENKQMQIKKVTSKLPGDTRWTGISDMFSSFINSKQVLRRLSLKHFFGRIMRKQQPFNLDNQILSDDFWQNCEETFEFFESIIIGIKIVEGDKSTLADVAHAYINYLESYEDKINDCKLLDNIEKLKAKNILKQRCEIKQPFVFAIYLIHPKFKGEKLTLNQRKEAKSFMIKYGENDLLITNEDEKQMFVDSLNNFNLNEGIYSDESCSDNIVPYKWWLLILKFSKDISKGDEILAKIASKLLAIRGSNAAAERSFSIQGLIQTKIRNKLSHPKVQKLMTIYCNHKKKNEQVVIRNEDAEWEEDEFDLGRAYDDDELLSFETY